MPMARAAIGSRTRQDLMGALSVGMGAEVSSILWTAVSLLPVLSF